MKAVLLIIAIAVSLQGVAMGHFGGHPHHHHHPRHLQDTDTPEEDIIYCNATQMSEKDQKMAQGIVDAYMADIDEQRRLQSTPINIPVYMHVVTDQRNNGFLSTGSMNKQMQVLNNVFSPHFNFELIETNYVANDDWFTNGLMYNSPSQREMKAANRRGGAGTLNIYSTNTPLSIEGTLLGVATFPFEYQSFPLDDGVVCFFNTFPGGSTSAYSEGVTTVHEVGHWLGLFHTFQPSVEGADGCAGTGDGVSDTPSEAEAAGGCPVGRDTCPAAAGLDPIRNMMDYTNDFCKDFENGEGITSGQFDRMLAMWAQFREGDTTVPEPAPMEPTTSGEVQVYVEIGYDRYPNETSWSLINSSGDVVLDFPRGAAYGVIHGTVMLPADKYTFRLRDSFGDGNCCLYGFGYYLFQTGGQTVASGKGEFDFELSHSFRLDSASEGSQIDINGSGSLAISSSAFLAGLAFSLIFVLVLS